MPGQARAGVWVHTKKACQRLAHPRKHPVHHDTGNPRCPRHKRHTTDNIDVAGNPISLHVAWRTCQRRELPWGTR